MASEMRPTMQDAGLGGGDRHRRFGGYCRSVRRLLRPLLILAGLTSLALGFAGLFLPLLPTTPFVLLAAACFVRSSDRLHAWLMAHRLFGGPLRDWHAGRGIPMRAKVVAITSMWSSMAASAWMLHARLGAGPAWFGALAFLGACAVVGPAYLAFRVPTRSASTSSTVTSPVANG